MLLKLSPKAEKDLEVIGDFIARDNPKRAFSFIGEIRAQCKKITNAPKAYRLRTEYGNNLRSYAYGNYLIFYTETPHLVQIVRILHGSMELKQHFFIEEQSAIYSST